MLDEPDRAGGDHSQTVIQHFWVQALQVGYVPRGEEGYDLTVVFDRQLIAAGVALHQQAALRRAVAKPHDALIGLEDLNLHRQRLERQPP
jgi:hypothetical protein